jgi:hypothetical protein
MLNVESPFFWRHLAVYVIGALFVGLPLVVHRLAPVGPFLIPVGAAMLGIAGTAAIKPTPAAPIFTRDRGSGSTPTKLPPAA